MYALLSAYGVIDRQGLGLNCEITWLEETKTRIKERLSQEIKIAKSDGFILKFKNDRMGSVGLSKPDDKESLLFVIEEIED